MHLQNYPNLNSPTVSFEQAEILIRLRRLSAPIPGPRRRGPAHKMFPTLQLDLQIQVELNLSVQVVLGSQSGLFD